MRLAQGVYCSIHNGVPAPAPALARQALGYRFVSVSSDARLIAAGSQQVLTAMRAG